MNDFYQKIEETGNFPQINPKTLENLRRSTANNPAMLKEIFQSFIEDSEDLMQEINDALNSNNNQMYASAVHSLKGLSGTIGCTRMFEILKLMDLLNKEAQFEESRKGLDILTANFRELEQIIESEIFSR